MSSRLLFAFWFFSPGGLATLMPVFLARLPLLKRWNAPIDGGHRWRGRRLLGDHKTWRGLLLGGLVGSLWFLVQRTLYAHHQAIRDFSPVDYETTAMLYAGILVSYGSVIGDALKSFFKRQFNVRPGQSWPPFDQLDQLIGGLGLSALVVRLSWQDYLTMTLMWVGIHLLSGYIGYRLHLKSHPF